ncbi:MAG: histidinol dehydrogenase, partial [Caldilineaceae bacterium]|nr:histidinol dehydrogenase [Caldilineaceae bacterium]
MSNLINILDAPTAQQTILRRLAWDELNIPDPILDRLEELFGQRISPDEAVRRILADVRQKGDAAILDYTQRIDGVELPGLVVSKAQIQAAYDQVEPQVVDAIRLSAQR